MSNELRPQVTSFSRRMGDQPMPSMAFSLKRKANFKPNKTYLNVEFLYLNIERQTSPFSLMFGCQSFVRHLTEGGIML